MAVTRLDNCESYGIFWDIENCPIVCRADVVVRNLKRFFAVRYETIVGHRREPCTFVCACDTAKVDPRNIEALNRSGVDILHVNPTYPIRPEQNFKVVADDKLKESIQKFTEHHNNPNQSLIFVITGDVDFAPQIRTARRTGFTVILLHGAHTSTQLIESVDECHAYYDVINDHFESNTGATGVNIGLPYCLTPLDPRISSISYVDDPDAAEMRRQHELTQLSELISRTSQLTIFGLKF